jgi:DNA polymerase-3 subunit epsilon
MKRQIVLDTETTGLSAKNGDRIIEIGCVELVNRRFTGRTFHQYINPERSIDVGAQAVHGISRDFLKDKPIFSAIVDAFFEFCEGAELIIHNAEFDIGFINAELKWVNYRCLDITTSCKVIDTLALARQKHPGQANNLDALCRRYSVDASRREFHGALLDANLLAQVFLSMTSEQASLWGLELPASQSMSSKPSEELVRVAPMAVGAALKVIRANLDEIKAHQAFIDSL